METPSAPRLLPVTGWRYASGVLWDTFDKNPGDIGITAETGDALSRHDKAVFEMMDNELDDSRGGATITRFRIGVGSSRTERCAARCGVQPQRRADSVMPAVTVQPIATTVIGRRAWLGWPS